MSSHSRGLVLPQQIAANTPNDGTFDMPVPCALTTQGRIRVSAADNIFFDVNNQDLTIVNDPPDIVVDPINGGDVDDNCEFLVQFTATVTDQCGVAAADVAVNLNPVQPPNYTLGAPNININQNGATQVDVSGSVLVFAIEGSPAKLQVIFNAEDNCGATDIAVRDVFITDSTPPMIEASVDPTTLWPPNHKMETITANVVVTDNCPGVSFVLADITSDEPDNAKGVGDGNTVNDIQNADIDTPDLSFDLRRERDKKQDGRTYTIVYTATDDANNASDDSATVTVAHDKGK